MVAPLRIQRERKRHIICTHSESKEEFNQMMQSLQSQQDIVEERLEALQSAPAEGWETLKSSTEEALNEMQQTYQKVANRFP